MNPQNVILFLQWELKSDCYFLSFVYVNHYSFQNVHQHQSLSSFELRADLVMFPGGAGEDACLVLPINALASKG